MQRIQTNNDNIRFHVRMLLLTSIGLLVAAQYLLLNVGVFRTLTVWLLATEESNDAHVFGEKWDSRESENVVLPNVLFIGVQKSGSTALAKWILYHDDVCGAGPSRRKKEVHFFDHLERYQKGLGAYSTLFTHCENTSLVLDATPDYFPVADRVRKMYDDAGGMHTKNLKIMVTLRDPVARELSIYNHKSYFARNSSDGWWHDVIKDDGSLMTFSDYVDNVTLPCIALTKSVSLYACHLREWMKAFDRSQILVLSYDELKQDTDRLLSRVREFLGLEGEEKKQLQQSNQKLSKEKVAMPTCNDKNKILSVLAAENVALFDLLHEQPGPPMEQRPFPKFTSSNCSSVDFDTRK